MQLLLRLSNNTSLERWSTVVRSFCSISCSSLFHKSYVVVACCWEFISVIFFSFVSNSLASINLPKNNRKIKINWDKGLTTTNILSLARHLQSRAPPFIVYRQWRSRTRFFQENLKWQRTHRLSWEIIRSTPDNSNLQGKSEKSRMIGSPKQIVGRKGKTSFYCPVNILIVEMLSENWKILLDYKSECNVKKIA